jgi:hypothetical protein
MSAPQFTLFVSSVEGKTVFRYGTRQLIGAKRAHVPPLTDKERPADRPAITVWNTERIVPITAQEAARYCKEYGREIRDGALKERTEAGWKAQNDADLKAEAKARDAAKAAKDAAEKAARAATPEN